MNTKTSRSVVGVGDLVYDHVFLNCGSESEYKHSRGGGSMPNALAQVAHLGGPARVIAAAGDDSFGREAAEEMDMLGVDCSQTTYLKERRTRIVWEIVNSVATANAVTRHQLTAVCAVCGGRLADSSVARIRDDQVASVETPRPGSVVIFDRLTKARHRLATRLRSAQVSPFLDLGRSAYLRYVPAESILRLLAPFVLIVAPRRVADTLVRRLGLPTVHALLQRQPGQVWLVTRGHRGLWVLDGRTQNIRIEEVSAPEVSSISDDAGAGDALMGGLAVAMVRDQRGVIGGTLQALMGAVEYALPEVVPVLEGIGARGHLPASPQADFEIPLAYKEKTIRELAVTAKGEEFCRFCQDIPGRQPAKVGKRRARVSGRMNLALVHRRAAFAAEHREAVASCRKVLNEGSGTAVVVGTGGSLAGAVYIAHALSASGRWFASAMRPLDYIRTGVRTDLVIVVSYSGSTVDCGRVMRHSIEALKVRQRMLITHSTTPRLGLQIKEGSDTIAAYGSGTNGSGERGFVTMAGSVAPAALWAAALGLPVGDVLARVVGEPSTPDWRVQVITLAEAVRERICIPVFGGGHAWPAMFDLESKWVEGGLGAVQIHETKDFSHGRFMSVLRGPQERTPAVVFQLAKPSRYESALVRTLSETRVVCVITSIEGGLLGGLELLMRGQWLCEAVARETGVDLARPGKIPKKGLALYRWRGLLK